MEQATNNDTMNSDDLTTNDSKVGLEADVEGEPKKLPYPRAVPFVIINEICERFMFYGMRAVLVLYLTRKLSYDDDTATIIYHTFNTLVYFICVFGAIISDGYLGKFKTILYLSIVYVFGSIVLALAAIPPLYLPEREMTIFGLLLIALGSGGIKPCVAAFGGDQFKIPEQAKQMAAFFSVFYFSINCGASISMFITPILREDVKCFDQDDCFSLAFGIPGLLMVIAISIFIGGKFLYTIKTPSGNMIGQVFKCICNAIKNSIQSDIPKQEHWIDYAEKSFSEELKRDTKILLGILLLYIPLPVFWALNDQEGSRWTFQATRMSGDLGFWEIKPDQMLVLSPILVLIFIPLYDVLFYPLLSKVGIRRPLQKIALGGILAGIAFLISGWVELELEKTYPVLPVNGESQLRIFNTMPCDYDIRTNISDQSTINIKSMDYFEDRNVAIQNDIEKFSCIFQPTTSDCPIFEEILKLGSAEANSYQIKQSGIVAYQDDPNKSSTGDPLIRILTNTAKLRGIRIVDLNRVGFERFSSNSTDISLFQTVASEFDIIVDDQIIGQFVARIGGVYTLLINEEEEHVFRVSLLEVTNANSMSMLWLVPQYVIMELGEVMFSVTGLAFSYAEAPSSMKSVVQAFWLLTTAVGNVIDIIVVGVEAFDSQAYEFFLFAIIMFVDMMVFIYLSYRYTRPQVQPVDERTLPNNGTDNILTSTALGDISFDKKK